MAASSGMKVRTLLALACVVACTGAANDTKSACTDGSCDAQQRRIPGVRVQAWRAARLLQNWREMHGFADVNISNEPTSGGTGTPTRVLERSGLAGIEKACRLLPNHEVSTCLSRARETETVFKYEMEKIFQAASQRVNHSWRTWPGFDYSDANITRVLAFTICTPGVGTSFDAIKGLCNAQREGMDIWGKRN